MKTIFIITLCLFSSLFTRLTAQTVNDFNKMKPVMDVSLHHHNYSMKGTSDDITFIMKGLFVFYKSFISSQDGNSCTFTPSCSEYAMESIQKKGLIIGLMASFDRLSRCNGLSPQNYPYDEQQHLLIDPVQ